MGEFGQCQVPGCKMPAIVVYNETNLCKDCYEQERARLLEAIQDNMID
jgi:hypothetical protein